MVHNGVHMTGKAEQPDPAASKAYSLSSGDPV